MNAWSRWRCHRADPPPLSSWRRPGPADAGEIGADTSSWFASRQWGQGSTEDATTRGRPDGESWNGRGRPPDTSARSGSSERSCLRVGAGEAGRVRAAERQRLRETEPLTGMAQAPGSESAPTAGTAYHWRQWGGGPERGDAERGGHGVPSTESTRRSQPHQRATGDGSKRADAANGPLRGTAAGNDRDGRRRLTGDRGSRDDGNDGCDVGHAGRHASEQLTISTLVLPACGGCSRA